MFYIIGRYEFIRALGKLESGVNWTGALKEDLPQFFKIFIYRLKFFLFIMKIVDNIVIAQFH